MATHLTNDDVDRYLGRKLSPQELRSADDHLATCDECLARVTGTQSPGAALRGAFAPDQSVGALDDHLTYEQLEAMVDGRADEVEREISLVHLAVCQACAAELRGLEELRPVARRWPRWGSLAAAAIIVVGTAVIAWQIWRPVQNETGVAVVSTTPPVVPSPSAVMTLNDAGGQVSLDASGRIMGLGDIESTTMGRAVTSALTTRQLSIANAIAGLRGPQGVLMGPGDGAPFRLTTPVGIGVRTGLPTLRWQPLAGADSYVVAVFDTTFKEVARSARLRATEWVVSPALGRGQVYVWQVAAMRDGVEIKSPQPPAPEARFRVISAAEDAAISRTEQTHASSHLVRGVVYAEAGLLAEAEREFRLLVDTNPSSDVANALLRQVTEKTRVGK